MQTTDERDHLAPDVGLDPAAAAPRRSRWRPTAQSVITAAVLVAAVGFTLSQLHPDLLVANTTTAGGDMGAHVWTPAYLRDHLLPQGRITGWTPDWYAGFPALTFYFPLPSLLIVALDVVLPYNVAFKLITVAGILSLPLAAWAFGKLAGLRFPVPVVMGVATLPFLFDAGFTIYGGNIASTLAGEFSFSISLSLGFLFLGVYVRGLASGRHGPLAAVLLAAAGLSHVIPTFYVVAGALVLTIFAVARHGFDRLRFAIPVLATGGLLAAFWLVPFVLRVPYMNDMGWEKLVDFREQLLPGSHGIELGSKWALVVLAAVGTAIAIGRRSQTGLFLVIMAATSALAVVHVPQTRLWNARLLPFWFLTLQLLAGYALGEAARGGTRALRWLRRRVLPGSDADTVAVTLERLPRLLMPPVALLYALLIVGPELGEIPSWVPVGKDTPPSFVPGWAKWNYEGYQRKSAYPEYRDLVATMRVVGEDHGCGRAMWEYEPELDRMGTPMALMLLPHWTDGCIGSMEGLFFESSASVPFHFLNQSELSERPSRPQRNLDYTDLDLDQGIRHLQMFGVRYYMALTDAAKDQARDHPALTLVASSGPWPVSYTENNVPVTKDRVWEIYLVRGSSVVAPLSHEPVVVRGLPEGGHGWLEEAEAWYNDPARWSVPLAADGPREWRRVDDAAAAPRDPLPAVRVRNVRTDEDGISFDVSRPGVPVLVRTSYFPNWKVSGGRGPWRVTPNLMVVVPTDRHVELKYGWTAPDVGGGLLTIAGIGVVVLLLRRGPVRFRPRRENQLSGESMDDEESSAPLDDGRPGEERLVGATAHPDDP